MIETKTINTTNITNAVSSEQSARRDGLDCVEILGVHVHRVSMVQTLSMLESMALDGQRNHVVTVNPEFIITAQKNHIFRDVLNRASLAIPDGIGVVWASKILRKPIPERVAGVDMVEQFAAIASRYKLRVFFLGAAPGIAERAAQVLQHQHPGFIIAGTYAGSPRLEDDDEICKRIQATSPHVLLVAYGAPQQDLWISRNMKRLNVPISIGVGGTFDYITGVVVRAPRWVQNMGLEWFHRLIKQPHRFQRMLALPRFAIAVLMQRLKTFVKIRTYL